MSDKYCVYRHINKLNNKQYIGITKRTLEERCGLNGIKYRSSPYFFNAINKYGWSNFEHEIIKSNLSKEEACELEKRLIREYKTQDKAFGYNIMEGGTAPSMPLEIRQYMSQIMRGNKNGLGKICSEEKKKKISMAQKGKKLSTEHRKNISAAKKNKPHKSPSMATRKKISDSHEKKKVYCYETDKVYPSIQECGRQLNIYATAICACCKGRHKSTHGYHFRYN